MAEPLGHERQITFFRKGGHNHDGENSSPVVLLPGTISLYHLNSALKDYIDGRTSEGFSGGDDNVMPIPDLVFETNPVGPGASVTGSIPWVGLAVVRFMRILMSQDSECTITFYHKSSFLDEDREFRAYRCANRFMWEGAWAHYDEDDTKSIHYKVENTGNQSCTFQFTLKSAVMAANAYSRFVQAIQADGTELTETIKLVAGNGMSIDVQAQNIVFSAVAPETVVVRRWATTPVKPVAYTSSATISSTATLDLGNNTAQVTFGTGLQWIQADIGSVVNLGGIRVVQFMADGRVFNGVKIEVSPDAVNWLEVKSSGSVWSTADGIQINIAGGYLARYIRLWCNGSSVNTTNFVSSIKPLVLSNKE